MDVTSKELWHIRGEFVPFIKAEICASDLRRDRGDTLVWETCGDSDQSLRWAVQLIRSVDCYGESNRRLFITEIATLRNTNHSNIMAIYTSD